MQKITRMTVIIPVILATLLLAGCNRQPNNTAQGYIEGRYTYVSSQMTGTLEKLRVQRGDPIKTGQSLAVLESNPQAAELAAAQDNLKKAEASLVNLEKAKRPTEIASIEAQRNAIIPQLKFARKTVKRYQNLAHQDYLTKERLDQAISNYGNLTEQLADFNERLATAKIPIGREDEIKAAKEAVNAAQANVEKAKWSLDQKHLFAPATGYVYDTYYRVGEVVPMNRPVLSMLAPQNVYVIFFLPEVELSRIKLGQKIKFTSDGNPKPIAATVYYISDKAEYTPPVIYSEQTRNKLVFRIEAKLSLQDAKKSHPGQPITVRF